MKLPTHLTEPNVTVSNGIGMSIIVAVVIEGFIGE